MSDLLQAHDGVISCTLCGAIVTGPHPCPVEAARRLLGGAPPALAARLYQAAGDASTARAVAADLRAVAEGVEALAGPIPEGRGPWQQTFTGERFYPLDPRPSEVHLADIAHHLALVCRFGGAVREHYSVAQHSCLVADYVADVETNDPRIILAALMHDAAEAYVGDMVRPLKGTMPAFREAEGRVWCAIAERFGLPSALPHGVHRGDDILLATEARDLMGGECAEKWGLRMTPLLGRIEPWGWERAEREFLERAARWGAAAAGRVAL